MGTFVQELNETHPAIRAACERHLTDHVAELARDVAEAKARYAQAASWNAESVAFYVQVVLQGWLIFAKAKQGAEVLSNPLRIFGGIWRCCSNLERTRAMPDLFVAGDPNVRIDEPAAAGSKAMLWTGRVLSGLASLFLLLDGVMKLVKPEPVVKATVELGYPEGVIVGLGVVLLVSTALYLIPRTAVLGAILLTGYLGGAVATHVRVGAPLFTHTLFPTYVGLLLWGGLYLRDRRLRALVPLRSDPARN